MWDIATTRVAGGKIQLAHSKGQELPAGWIIDKDGNPSTDPDDYYDGGALLPFGEHKGFGLMVASEILGRILTGSEDYVEDRGGGVHHAKQGAALIAVDAGVFTSAEQFSSRTTDLMNSIRRFRRGPDSPRYWRRVTSNTQAERKGKQKGFRFRNPPGTKSSKRRSLWG